MCFLELLHTFCHRLKETKMPSLPGHLRIIAQKTLTMQGFCHKMSHSYQERLFRCSLIEFYAILIGWLRIVINHLTIFAYIFEQNSFVQKVRFWLTNLNFMLMYGM